MSNSPERLKNVVIALVAVFLSVSIYFSFQNQSASTSLDLQAKNSLPLNVALTNNKPTLAEFYADWCTSCQAMAKDLSIVKKKYGESVNFVMLNIDNDKWLPEVLRYRVDGIPHFVFFDKEGKTIAQTIGEQPLTVLEANLAALAIGDSLPYATASGTVSPVKPQLESNQAIEPRSHGG